MIMTYTSWFEPMLFIFLSLTLGLLIGSVFTLWTTMKETKAINEELNAKNRELKGWVDRWKNKYTDDDPENEIEL